LEKGTSRIRGGLIEIARTAGGKKRRSPRRKKRGIQKKKKKNTRAFFNWVSRTPFLRTRVMGVKTRKHRCRRNREEKKKKKGARRTGGRVPEEVLKVEAEPLA